MLSLTKILPMFARSQLAFSAPYIQDTAICNTVATLACKDLEGILKKLGQNASPDIFLPFCSVFILCSQRVKNTRKVNNMSSD